MIPLCGKYQAIVAQPIDYENLNKEIDGEIR
jgi:hypothetical protein